MNALLATIDDVALIEPYEATIVADTFVAQQGS